MVVVDTPLAITWSCERCTYINPAGNKACELCSTSRFTLKGKTTAPPTPRHLRCKELTKSKVKAEVSCPWTCQSCTFINDTPSLACSLCDTRRRMIATASNRKPRGQASLMESIDSSSSDDCNSIQTSAKSQLSQSFDRSNASNTVDNALWNDKYQPNDTIEVVMHPKKAQEVSDWLVHSSTHQRILFLCGPPGTGKSTLVRSLAAKLGMTVKEWHDTTGMVPGYSKLSASAMDDFGSFLERSQRYPSLRFANAKTNAAKHVILVEEWPSFHSDHRVELQRILQRRLDVQGSHAFAAPIVIVYSDVREGKVTANKLAKEFSPQVMQSPLVHIIHCNPIPPGMLKKYVMHVARKERMALSTQDVTNIVESSRGDIRHAINTLQFQRTSTAHTKESGTRDLFLSDFHVIGKILHQKDSSNDSTRLSHTSLDTSHALGMLHHNFVAFFTDVDDVARALDYFSFTDVLLQSVYHDRSNSNYFQHTHELAQTVLERTIHVTNNHAATSAFRPLHRSQFAAASQRVRDDDPLKHDSSYHRDVRPYLQWLPHSSLGPTQAFLADDVDDDIVDSE
ncbi:hypothetical protein, variant [Aphanomyces invadans]|nr:hypothetical protein, variant [Aphanomyces invadans]ETW08024.1 hypothetical protein, variant [Aphanomyces invadans]|eukprot:XP_008864117.1 hypothetical protein, variant [Aphanomyces invadans]